MTIKRILACLCASVMMCAVITSCKSKNKDNDTEPFEPSVAAQSGEAYINIIDGSHWIQYLGKNDENQHNMLSYNAGVAAIRGNGDYKVSVTTNTDGFRNAVSGDRNNKSVVPSGLSFLAVMIKDGESLFPDAIITVNSVKVNGKEIPLTAKPYTSSDDGKDTRANIFNEWTGGSIPKDARSVQGKLYGADGKPAAFMEEYSSVAVNSSDFAKWSDVEINFTVSNIK